MGFQPREVIREVLSQADVFVLPTVLESFGIAALEARCAGVPVVARTQSGVSEFIKDGVEGLLASSDEEMADRITRLIVDEELRNSIAAYNRSTPGPATDWRHVVERHLQMYQRAGEILPEGANSVPPTALSAHRLQGHVSPANRVPVKE